MTNVFCVQASGALLLAALLFLCGEIYKKLGLSRHLVPAALGFSGVLLAAGLGISEGISIQKAVLGGILPGIFGAALCVYAHQLCVQAMRSDIWQAPFKGFYFDKKGEGG